MEVVPCPTLLPRRLRNPSSRERGARTKKSRMASRRSGTPRPSYNHPPPPILATPGVLRWDPITPTNPTTCHANWRSPHEEAASRRKKWASNDCAAQGPGREARNETSSFRVYPSRPNSLRFGLRESSFTSDSSTHVTRALASSICVLWHHPFG
jgi:hypothetical protein